MAETNIVADSGSISGLNKEARLRKEAAAKEEAIAPVLNAPYPFGGVAFPVRLFGARRSDETEVN